MSENPDMKHMLAKDEDGTYRFAAMGLSYGEALEMLITMRRLELYRTVDIDTDVVENAMRTMATFQTKVTI